MNITTANITTAQLAAEVLTVIPDEYHWIQHNDVMWHRRCVLGALNHVADRLQLAYSVVLSQFAPAFCQVAHEQYPDRYPSRPGSNDVIGINDNSRTRYADIRLILEKMAAQEGE